MIQLIVSDMDGTLLDPEKHLPDHFSALLEELYCRDITFAVASGRSRAALLDLFGTMAEDMIFICDNGACVMLPHRAPILNRLSSRPIEQVLNLCQTLPGTTPVLCGFHHIYVPDTASESVRQEISRFYADFQILSYDKLYQVDEPILKIALCDQQTLEQKTYPAVQTLLGEEYEQLISGDCWMDIMEKGITKGMAVTLLQERLGITPAETMVFGDYDNDISMLSCAAYSYAMANASERVREQARFQAPSNAENGVMQVICEKLGIHFRNSIDA